MGLTAIQQSRTHVCRTAILGFVLAVAVHVPAAHGTTIPPELGNLEVLSEAALTSTAIVTDIFGFVASEQLEFAGTFTDTDWSLAVMGNYAALPVNIVVDGPEQSHPHGTLYTAPTEPPGAAASIRYCARI